MSENKIPFIRIENVSFSYEGDEEGVLLPPVIKNVSLDIEKGSFVALLGHNGSGKSTLAKLINLVLTPTEGKIYIDGTDITSEELTEDELKKAEDSTTQIWDSAGSMYEKNFGINKLSTIFLTRFQGLTILFKSSWQIK